jgi:tRNA dimethylallyltransferase
MEINTNDNIQPIIYILGPTGVGKTYLSLKLSKHINCEIINTDAFSLYKDANIMTAKATPSEIQTIPHKMINIINLFDINYNITSFEKDASNEINTILSSNKTPLIVGGTNYYVERLLFNKTTELPITQQEINTSEIPNDFMLKINLLKNEIQDKDELYTHIEQYLTNEYSVNNSEHLYKILEIIDKEYANFYHKKDIRRIINAISFYYTYGYKKSSKDINTKKTLKYLNQIKLIFLNPCNQDNENDINSLIEKIKQRVKELLNNGLSEIIFIFHKFNKNNIEISFTKGILQAIGYKEFYPLYQVLPAEIKDYIYNEYKYDNSSLLSSKIFDVVIKENLLNIYEECKEELITNTINYAKYQLKLIKKKILSFISNYLQVNVTQLTKEVFNEIYIPQCVKYINDKDKFVTIINEDLLSNNIKIWNKYYCDICKVELNGEVEYQSHMKSNKHKKRKNGLNKHNKHKNNIINKK